MTTLTELSGDAELLRSKAEHYLTVADAIHEVNIALKKVSDPDKTKSKSISAIRGQAKEVGATIGQAEERYRETSTALRTYAIALKAAKERAHAAIIAANEADDDGYARSQRDHYEQLAQVPDAEQASNHKLYTYWKNKAEHRAIASSNAVSNWQGANDDKNSAAQMAASAIAASFKNSKLNDGFWDHAHQLFDRFVEFLKTACAIAGFLSLFLSWVPFLGQALLALAIIGALLTLLDTIVAMTKGEAGFWDLMGAVLGVGLAVFGGKIFGYLGKLAKTKGISAAMRQGGPIKNLTGLGKGNYLRGAANELKSAHPFDNPFKLGLGPATWGNIKNQAVKFFTNPQKMLGVDKTFFMHGFDSSIIRSSPSMLLSSIASTAYEVNTVLGKVEKAVNPFLGSDQKLQLNLT